jgi:hypothetical protein
MAKREIKGQFWQQQETERAAFEKKLTKFRAKFGHENGAKWAGQGLTYVQALERHADELAATNAALLKDIEQKRTRLSALNKQLRSK